VILDHGGFEESMGPNYFSKQRMVTGEETVLGRRIRASGHQIVYQPNAIVKHHVSGRKKTRRYFLKRHFWEGVTVIQEMQLMKQVGESRLPHYRYHTREICLALARFVLPGYQHIYASPRPVIRMRSLGSIAYSMGILWGLTAAGREARKQSQCASA
jgi:hypothetical protein